MLHFMVSQLLRQYDVVLAPDMHVAPALLT
jgi:hypothetical protein